MVKELSDKIQPLQEQLFREKQTNTQLARQVIKFTEDLDNVDREKRAKEKEISTIKNDIQDNYVSRQAYENLER